MPDVDIRRLEGVGCIDSLAGLFRALHEAQTVAAPQLAGMPGRTAEDAWVRRRVAYSQWLATPDAFVLLAVRAGEPVGYALVTLAGAYHGWSSGTRVGELKDLAVLPHEQGRGIGSRLLDEVERKLAELGVEQFRLNVIAANADAIRLYERRGMTHVTSVFLGDLRRLGSPRMTQLDPRSRPSDRDVRPWIEAWATAPELVELVVAFGGEQPADRELRDWLGYLDGFSVRWDSRKGVERDQVADQQLAAGFAEPVLAAADCLGLRGATAPARTDYEVVVILGGLVRACFTRPLHAARLLREGRVRARGVVGLGGSRPLSDKEIALIAPIYEAPLKDEFDAMQAGVRAAFNLTGDHEVAPEHPDLLAGALMSASYRSADGLPVHVVATPPLEDRPRANTADTYDWLARRPGLVKPGDRLLLVTTSIYVPYQHADAIRMLTLPHGIEVDTVGIEPGDVDERLAQPFAAHNYLQEIRSTIRALRMLLDAA